MKSLAAGVLIAAAFAAGLAQGQEDGGRKHSGLSAETLEKLKNVRRERKVIELDTAVLRVPPVVEREKQYQTLLEEMLATVQAGKDVRPLLERGRQMKLQALQDYNDILKLHRGKHIGLSEEEVWNRLRDARFKGVDYEDEWLVNILDDLEDTVKINIEMDARVYKYDTVSFNFEETSARAMLQIMGDQLLFKWLIRGDTLYVFKERHEILFGGEWIKQKKAAWKARKEALEKAAKEAEARALEGADK